MSYGYTIPNWNVTIEVCTGLIAALAMILWIDNYLDASFLDMSFSSFLDVSYLDTSKLDVSFLDLRRFCKNPFLVHH